MTRVSIIVARSINLAKNSIQQRRAGWLSRLGLGLVVRWYGGPGFESRLVYEFFFFFLTLEKFLNFLVGLVAGTRSAKFPVPVPGL